MKTLLPIIFCILLISLLGCTPTNLDLPTDPQAEAKADATYYDASTGMIYDTLSKNVDIKLNKWELKRNERNQEVIILDILIKNKTGKSLKDFNCIIAFDDAAKGLFATGITVYDKFEPVDLIPKTTANGSGYAVEFTVESDQRLQEMALEKDALMDHVRHITLDLTWEGGGETIDMALEKVLVNN